jgi:hypothetical protein
VDSKAMQEMQEMQEKRGVEDRGRLEYEGGEEREKQQRREQDEPARLELEREEIDDLPWPGLRGYAHRAPLLPGQLAGAERLSAS